MLLLLLVACSPSPVSAQEEVQEPADISTAPPLVQTVAMAFPPPEGAERALTDGFGSWLRTLPLRPADEPVRTYDGRVVPHHARVVDLPLVPGDLQQCADSLIRLRAEWLRKTGQAISFHATSGDALPWSRWQAGERPYVSGNKVRWRAGTEGGWEEYLAAVFTWAGTASLQRLDTVPVVDPRGGDLFVAGGSPGHAVQILDLATRGGHTYALIGEGFMPAQSFHIELGPEEGWWPVDEGLSLPYWSFEASALRRWR